MNVSFNGGPWNGAEINLSRFPTWITFSADIWTGGDDRIPIGDTRVLSAPCDFTYLLEKDEEGSLRYALRIIQEP